MNRLKIIGMMMVVLLSAAGACATLYTETFSSVNNSVIPQGNPAGVSFSDTVSDIPAGMTVSGLTVNLTISGGYNAGLVAYLVAPNGTLVMLMNQPGVSGSNPFGASGAGMNITLADGGANGNIQNETSSAVLGGTYAADGSLSSFNSSVVDGTWTLYFADVDSGAGSPTLNSFSLGVTPVPEPIVTALAVFGIILASVTGFKGVRTLIARSQRRKLHHPAIFVSN